ncbi:MAG: carbamoyl-phosphate synthase small subunit, partial [Acidimicrobiaceae bacterium]
MSEDRSAAEARSDHAAMSDSTSRSGQVQGGHSHPEPAQNSGGGGRRLPALLVLADGTTFEGEAVGYQPADGVTTGEVVFNTVLSGYQEVLTDPSYAGQVVAFTYPHIGNYGVAEDDNESRRPHCRGVVVR